MPRLRAQRILDRASTGDLSLNRDGWYNLTLQATGSKEAAQEAMKQYILRCHQQGVDPQ